MQRRLQKEEAEHRAKQEQVLAAERESAQKAITAERPLLEKQKAELERQQQFLQKNLEHVTKELREAGDNVVNRLLNHRATAGLNGRFFRTAARR